MRIGPYKFANQLALAPMAGVTDRPFRQLCRRNGAGMAASEMLTVRPELWDTDKSRLRMDHAGEPEPRIVQIAGGDPGMVANAARVNVERGAQIIDINMGCPAKKVCRKLAGSALLKDEDLVRRILESTVDAVDVPVTLKIRTGWSPENRNGVRIAEIAAQAGIQALAVHGRTRACRFGGHAEYDTIRAIKHAIDIPVIANGDIGSAAQARTVLDYTGADGIMIGRAAQGRPWIFREIDRHLNGARNDSGATEPDNIELRDMILGHLEELYAFYGEVRGVKVARKHLSWYCNARPEASDYRERVVRVSSATEQVRLTEQYFAERSGQGAAAA